MDYGKMGTYTLTSHVKLKNLVCTIIEVTPIHIWGDLTIIDMWYQHHIREDVLVDMWDTLGTYPV